MNRLLEVLDKRGEVNLASLKVLYRKLALGLHPDLHPGDSKSAEGFINLQRAYEEAVSKIAIPVAVEPSENKPPSFYEYFEAYLDNIDELNIVLSMASNPAKAKFDEFIGCLSSRPDLLGLFTEYGELFHASSNAILRYPAVRTSFITLHSAFWQLVQVVRHGTAFAGHVCLTYLEETEELLSKSDSIASSAAQNEINVIRRLAVFVRDELGRLMQGFPEWSGDSGKKIKNPGR